MKKVSQYIDILVMYLLGISRKEELHIPNYLMHIGANNMKKILLLTLLFTNINCFNNDNDFISKKILNSRLTEFMNSVINENSQAKLFGLYFVKYSQDTSSYIFVSLPATKESIIINLTQL